MKHLILIRHAKSSWANALPDHDRPLNKRGRGDAPLIGAWLREHGYLPDLVLCSDAVRTMETWDRLDLRAPVAYRADLYHASPETIAQILRKQTAKTVALIAHNPGIGEFAHWLASAPPKNPRFQDYPTAATTVFDLPDWHVTQGCGTVADFMTPHSLK